MRIGVPKEIKKLEYRVGMTPDSVLELTRLGHEVIVETGAGAGIDMTDEQYVEAGAEIGDTDAAWAADMIVKVKEPQPAECERLRADQTLFTYLHLAADKPQAEALARSGALCIAYETVTGATGGLPLLRPMSEVAGRMSVQVGAWCLEKAQGGRGTLLGGVPGVSSGEVVILGGGVSGFNAAQMAVGLHADVTLFDVSINRLEELDELFKNRLQTVYATRGAITEAIRTADLVIGAVLVPGAAAPKLVTRDMLSLMKPGAVLVDIAIDQGGCFETSKPTSHDDPIYTVDGIVHYCVANMPGAVPRTSTFALNNRTLPHIVNLAEHGPREALRRDVHLRNGLNVADGHITCEPVATSLDMAYKPADSVL
ncbi:alanine dehydrogenase [Parvularcula dongshanensis]|uniref:Alanine dehydrogenase n=1 Tax=Parvularcula dongshanensis TaxID=1173995 RepID=A0A840I0N8_9PROT|nr:alanine dehydrogenase [Parvularcula dongshanensis]MBB4657670.1 alanine dehydrogenase [Parvularcula dongshanensis]